MGLSHLFSALLVGGRFPGSWNQNGHVSNLLLPPQHPGRERGRGSRQCPVSSGFHKRSSPRPSAGSWGKGDPRTPCPALGPVRAAHTQALPVPSPPRAKDRVAAFPEGQATGWPIRNGPIVAGRCAWRWRGGWEAGHPASAWQWNRVYFWRPRIAKYVRVSSGNRRPATPLRWS